MKANWDFIWMQGPQIHCSIWYIKCSHAECERRAQVKQGVFLFTWFQTVYCCVFIVHVHMAMMMKTQFTDQHCSLRKATVVSFRWFTSLKTGYITAYSVMDTMEFVSASFFISSIVILQGGATLGEKVRRKLQLTHTQTYTHPRTHTL